MQQAFLELLIWQQLLLVFAVIFFISQLYFYLRFHLASVYSVKLTENANKDKMPVSVIICAKNEAHTLSKNLEKVLEQDYPTFQVVVVNDCSEDDTKDVLEQFQRKYSHLYVTTIPYDPIHKHGKKLAVTVGVKAAKYEHLLFTDADCIPQSDQWISKMVSNFSEEKDIVLGVYKLASKKGLLNRVQRYENLRSKMQYIGSAGIGKAFMGAGGNLAYKKSLFFKAKGFAGHYHVPSGDDDLFVNRMATKKNVAVEIHPDAQVLTNGMNKWSHWFRQKRRHMGAAGYYKAKNKARLFYDTFSMGMFYVISVLCITLNIFPFVMLGLLGFRLLLEFLILNLVSRKLNHSKFIFSFLLYDLLLPAVYLILVWKNKLNPHGTRWR